MKKNLILLVVCAFALSSCLGDSSYEATFNPVDTFEGFQDNDKDSLFFGPTFYSSYFGYMNSAEGLENGQEADRLIGGFGMSNRIIRWVLPDNTTPEAIVPLEAEETPYQNDNLFMTVFQELDENTPDKNSYAVFYNSSDMPEHHITFMASNGGTWTPRGCYIANTAFTVARATGHDISAFTPNPTTTGYAEYPQFTFQKKSDATASTEDAGGDEMTTAEGDFIKIVAKGYKEGSDAETGKAEIYLVNYQTADTLMTAWKPLDLSALGEVNYIDFTVESSQSVKDNNFPIYFCLDNMTSNVHIKY